DLLSLLPDGVAATETRDLLRRAYDFAGGADARRPLHVAHLLAELHLGPAVIAAGLLYATPATPEQLREQFGVEVATLVEGVARLGDVEQRVQQEGERSRDLQELESLRKVFIAMAVDDVRVIFIKLADRLCKMRTLSALPPAEQRRTARETAEIFAPLANRLGIWRWKAELEDLAFRVLNPEMYGELAQLLDARKDARQARLNRHIELLYRSLAQEGLTGEIKGRPKHIYSIYLKMRRKDVPFSQIYDAEGLRVIVETEPQCYQVLGVAHRLWTPVPGEFDDYIAKSKPNGYQSLHTAVIGEDGRPLEIQIRTPEMDHIAEFGVAATHWRYKEQHSQVSEQMAEYITQMRQGVRELLQETEEGSLEEVRSDIFDDRVYVFTPKGKIIDLPAGATPVDFAYRIHTDVGHRCRGAEVNGTWTALGYRLKNGDRVKIVTGRAGGPSRDWLNAELGFARTARARQKIKQWFRQQSREENITRGRLIVERELKRLGLVFTIGEVADFFAKRYPRRDDFLVAVGIGEVTGERIVNRIEDVLRCQEKEEA
ncbi:MAG: RelA/SpoT family protein, partial [Chloroflexota bacterium]|nr:RelA/SpoT family protein [Chloroflexota bacterium]